MQGKLRIGKTLECTKIRISKGSILEENQRKSWLENVWMKIFLFFKKGKVKDPRSPIELKESPGENQERVKDRVYPEVNRLIGARALAILLRLYPQTVLNSADEVTYFLL